VYSLTERLQFDGEPVSEEEFCDLFQQFIDAMGSDFDASYFELLIVFVLWAFAKKGVDYAVVETGLGGLHDGTNVCRRADKVCVITDIGFDHQHVLGATLPEIAAQKAGIIHKGNHAFMYEQASDVMQQIEQRVESVGANLHLVHPEMLTDSLLPTFQQRNWGLALSAFDYVATRDSLRRLDLHELHKTQGEVPGRMQLLRVRDMDFVFDGAHNEQKMRAFVTSFQDRYPNVKVPILLAMKHNKDYVKAIELLEPIALSVYCGGFSASQDMYITSVEPEVLVAACEKAGIKNAQIVRSIEDGIRKLLDLKQKLAIVTGSFYMLDVAAQALQKSKDIK
jgi:dihydrofolate synthase/folylpolyglutamate synthase